MSLTEKQRRFAEEYCVDGNATQAAIRAMYSEKTAYSQGQRLLKNVDVAAAIKARQDQHAERCNVTVDSLTAELDEAKELARTEGQPGAFVQAVMGKAKLHGLITDKKQHDISGGLAEILKNAGGKSGTFAAWRKAAGRSGLETE